MLHTHQIYIVHIDRIPFGEETGLSFILKLSSGVSHTVLVACLKLIVEVEQRVSVLTVEAICLVANPGWITIFREGLHYIPFSFNTLSLLCTLPKGP